MKAWLDRTLYPDYGPNWDDELFRKRVLARLSSVPFSTILDLGAGAGILKQMDFRGHAGRICGLDPDPRVMHNPHLNEANVGSGDHIPYPDHEFDLVVANNVLEHLTDPRGVFHEIHRVLKPGGAFLFKTPNRFHYVPLVAKLTPHRFHTWVSGIRGRSEVDTFPTVYRANDVATIHGLASSTGFSVERLELVEGRPEYLRISPPTYLLGWLYERAVNGTPFLERFRVIMIGELVTVG